LGVQGDLEYLAGLVAESAGCLPDETIGSLLDLCLEAVEVDLPCTLRVFDAGVFRACIPLCQLPEAWANLNHIVCSHDYDAYPGYRPGRGWVVLDVGAYLGFYSLYAAALGAEVYAFEPNPAARTAIRCGAEESGVAGRVVIDHRAVCGPGRRLAVIRVTEYWATSSMLPGYASRMGRVVDLVEAPCTTIAEAVRFYQLERVDLVKVDVEGAELEVLEGLEGAEAPVERLVVEVHPGAVSVDAVKKLLSGQGYRVEYSRRVSEGQLVLYARLRRRGGGG